MYQRSDEKVSIKNIVFSLGLLASSLSQAALHQAPLCSGDNQLPCEARAYDFGLDVLYFQNTANLMTHNIYTEGEENTLNKGFNPNMGFGARLEGSYHFANGNAFTLTWSHFAKDSDGQTLYSNLFNDEAVPGSFTSFTQKSKFDIVNAELSQRLDFANRYELLIHGGVQYASMREVYIARNAVGAPAEQSAAGSKLFSEQINGIGPRVGIKSQFHTMKHIDLFANIATTALYTRNSVHSLRALKIYTNTEIMSANSSARYLKLDLAGDIAVGARYHVPTKHGDVSVKAAWEDHIYINAGFLDYNVSWQGVSLGVKWVGNA